MHKHHSDLRVMTFAPVLALLMFAAILATAQVTTGSLQGVVFDQNKSVIAGAMVRVTNKETGQSRETITNGQGFYRVTNLIPGNRYQIEISASGFAKKVLENVLVKLGTEISSDVELSVSVSQEVVQVTGDSLILDTSQSQLSTSYSNIQVSQLPINGGSIDNLALLTPGVLTSGDALFTNGVGIAANGNRGRSNNFQIDGQDNNDNSVAGPSLTLTNTEAIGSFQVVTSNFSAEYGRNSGAQVNIVTKNGTNEFHGSVFNYLQNSALNARDNTDKRSQAGYQFLASNGFSQFSGLAGRDKDPYTYNRFGGSLGGPIIRNKFFFFATYQGDRQRGESQTNNFTTNQLTLDSASAQIAARLFPNAATQALVSTAVAGGPAFAQGVGNFMIAPPLIDTDNNGVPDAFAYPGTANQLSDGLYVNDGGVIKPLYFGEGVRMIRNDYGEDQVITREDINLSEKDVIGVRTIYDSTRFPLATGRFLAGAIFDVPSKNYNLGVTYTHTLNPRFVNEGRFNFSRLNVRFGDPNTTLPGPSIGFSGTYNLNQDSSFTFGTPNNLPQSRKVDVYQYQDIISATFGNHGTKFGADIRQQKVENFFLPNFLGVYTFSGSNPTVTTANAASGQIPAGTPFVTPAGADRAGFRATAFENFLLGRPTQTTFALGNPRIRTNQNDVFLFLQDGWRIRTNLTLDLGVRYELSTQPLNPIVDQINARESNLATAIFNTAFDVATRSATRVKTDKNNIAPRLGFAWQPNFRFLGDRFSGGKLVLRGGFGISYDPSYFNIVLNTVTAAPYAAAGRVTQTPGGLNSVNFPFLPSTTAQLNTTPNTNGGDPRLFSQTRVDPNFYNPYTMSYNFGIQQELAKNTVLEVRYVGSRIVGQFQTINGNPNVQFLNRAAQCLGLDPGSFSNGLVVGSPAVAQMTLTDQQVACGNLGSVAAGFNNRLGTTGNGRIDPNFGPVRLRINGASATYHSLQTRFDTRLSNRLTLNANYTFSRTIDNASEIFSTGLGGQGVADPQSFFNSTNGERGLSAFHQKHNFTANFVYDLPLFREQKGLFGKLFGGYQLASILRLGSGRAYTPINVLGTYDRDFENGFIGLGALRPFNGNPNAPNSTVAFGFTAACGLPLFDCSNVVGTPQPGNFIVYDTSKPGSTGTVVTDALAAQQQARIIYNDFGLGNQFGIPVDQLEAFNFFGTPFGNVGRNTFTGAPFYLVNLGLFKTTNLTERYKLEFGVQADNVLNHRNFGVADPVTEDAFTGSTVGTYQNPGFNNGSQRTMRLGLKLMF